MVDWSTKRGYGATECNVTQQLQKYFTPEQLLLRCSATTLVVIASCMLYRATAGDIYIAAMAQNDMFGYVGAAYPGLVVGTTNDGFQRDRDELVELGRRLRMRYPNRRRLFREPDVRAMIEEMIAERPRLEFPTTPVTPATSERVVPATVQRLRFDLMEQ